VEAILKLTNEDALGTGSASLGLEPNKGSDIHPLLVRTNFFDVDMNTLAKFSEGIQSSQFEKQKKYNGCKQKIGFACQTC
jgi:hypothetical protein